MTRKRSHALHLVTLTVLLLMATGSVDVLLEAQPGTLFVESPSATGDISPATAQKRAREVAVNFAMLPGEVSADRPARITLNPFDDVAFVGIFDSIESAGLGTSTYIGHIEGVDESSVVLVVSDGVMVGTIEMPDALFQVRFDGKSHVIRQVDPMAYPDELHGTPTRDLPVVMDPGGGGASDDGSRVDVMVLYTATARAAEGGTAAIRNLITLGVTETNQMYTNSGIGTRMRLVHMAEVAYAESGDAETDRNRLFNGSDGILDAVHSWRTTYGADMVQMLVNNAGSGCGIAYLNGPVASMAGQSAYAYAVTDRTCVSPNYTFAHEFGHIQGSNHAPDDPTGTGAYSYSFGFKRCTTAPNFRSVMAYACTSGNTGTARSKYFSNPAVNFSGAPTGTATQNNAVSMHNTRNIVANFRQQRPLVDITSLWAPYGDPRPGQTSRLWAYVVNNGPYALDSSSRVWFWTDGPSTSTGEGWVGGTVLTGLAPGAGAWYPFDWTKPGSVNPGTWQYWARVYDHTDAEYLSDWQGPTSFTVPSLDATATSYAADDTHVGGRTRLWGHAQNTGTAAFPANVYVYFWVYGPSQSGYVGYTNVASHNPGTGSWYGFDWDVWPMTRPAGTYTYWAKVRYLDGNNVWNDLSGWSAGQSFTVTAAPAYAGRVESLWTVSKPAGGAPQAGQLARLWALPRNIGANTYDANTFVYYWVSGPSTNGYVGSNVLTGLAPTAAVWKNEDWTPPAAGNYTYWGIIWRWNGSSWVNLSGWSYGQPFTVGAAADGSTGIDGLYSTDPSPTEPPNPPPPPLAGRPPSGGEQ